MSESFGMYDSWQMSPSVYPPRVTTCQLTVPFPLTGRSGLEIRRWRYGDPVTTVAGGERPQPFTLAAAGGLSAYYPIRAMWGICAWNTVVG